MIVFILSARNIEFYSLEQIARECSLFLVASPSQAKHLSRDLRRHFIEVIEVAETLDSVSQVLTFNKAGVIRAIQGRTAPGADLRLVCGQESNLMVAAEIRELLDIPGPRPRQIMPFRDKVAMKERLGALHQHLPRYVDLAMLGGRLLSDPDASYEALAAELGHPFLVKPRSSVGSRGIFIIRTPGDLASFIGHQGEGVLSYEADEYLEGTLYHCDTVMQAGRVLFSECSRYSCPNLLFQFGKNLGSLALEPDAPEAMRLKEFSRSVLSRFDLPDSAFHMEIFLRPDGAPVFLEVAARAPGLLTVPVYTIKHGVNMLDLELMAQTGLRFASSVSTRAQGSFYMVFPKKRGTVAAIRQPAIESASSIEWKVQVGERSDGTKSNLDYAGLMLAHGRADQIREDFERVSGFDPIVTVEGR